MNGEEDIQKLTDEIKTLKEELREREQSLPAHSIHPHQLQTIEELEKRVEALEEKVKQRTKSLSPG